MTRSLTESKRPTSVVVPGGPFAVLFVTPGVARLLNSSSRWSCQVVHRPVLFLRTSLIRPMTLSSGSHEIGSLRWTPQQQYR